MDTRSYENRGWSHDNDSRHSSSDESYISRSDDDELEQVNQSLDILFARINGMEDLIKGDLIPIINRNVVNVTDTAKYLTDGIKKHDLISNQVHNLWVESSHLHVKIERIMEVHNKIKRELIEQNQGLKDTVYILKQVIFVAVGAILMCFMLIISK